jgi:hypothetical protein
MTKLRKSARGRNCEIRIPGVCNGNSETTVLCHLPGGGMGSKRPDLFGAFGCSDCHAAVDGVLPTNYHAETLSMWHMDAVFRTQEIWLKEGLVKI